MQDSLKFGTSGLRGLVGELEANAGRYTAAFVRYLDEANLLDGGSALLVGADLRESSPGIVARVVAAAAGCGLSAIDCGVLPTPALALRSRVLGYPAIMVTGSHIPADRNGLKFYRGGDEITKADENGIQAALGEDEDAPRGDRAPARGDEALAEYVARCQVILSADALRGQRIGVFQHSAVARDLMADVLTFYGADVVALGRSDHFVPVDTEAVSAEVAAQVAAWVREHRLDALVSTDGDSDRPLVADETGTLVRGDILGLLTARFIGADAVVTPVTSNSAVELSGLFQAVRRTRVGSPYVIAGMNQAVAAGGRVVVGFEANGGVLLGSDAVLGNRTLPALPTRDAMLPILSVLGLARAEGVSLGTLVARLPPRFTASDRLEHVATEKTQALLRTLADIADERRRYFAPLASEELELSTVDGLRVSFGNGSTVHYRASGNAPELRCYAEADTPAKAEALLRWGLGAASSAID